MSRVLVLGGTGSIGRLGVARLLELDDQSRVLTRDPDRARRVLPDTAEVVARDLNDTAGLILPPLPIWPGIQIPGQKAFGT